MTKARTIVICICLAVALGLLAWDLLGTIMWDGGFDLPIRIVEAGRPVGRGDIVSVQYGCVLSPRGEEDFIPVEETTSLSEARFDGREFVASVPCYGTTSGLGLRETYGQFRSIFIRVELTDGRTVRLTCPVSDREHEPRIVVDVGGPGGVATSTQSSR